MNIAQMIQNNGKNQFKIPSQNEIKNKLKSVSDDELKKIADQARKMGMNENQINEGLKFIQSWR